MFVEIMRRKLIWEILSKVNFSSFFKIIFGKSKSLASSLKLFLQYLIGFKAWISNSFMKTFFHHITLLF